MYGSYARFVKTKIMEIPKERGLILKIPLIPSLSHGINVIQVSHIIIFKSVSTNNVSSSLLSFLEPAILLGTLICLAIVHRVSPRVCSHVLSVLSSGPGVSEGENFKKVCSFDLGVAV